MTTIDRHRKPGGSIRPIAHLLLPLMIVAGGCRASGDDSAASSDPAAPKVVVTKHGSPTDGPFVGITIGDSVEAVRAAVGDPTITRGHVMGKNFNPLYWGGDRYHSIWYYAGKGRITFDTKGKVMMIETDPSEDGHAGRR